MVIPVWESMLCRESEEKEVRERNWWHALQRDGTETGVREKGVVRR